MDLITWNSQGDKFGSIKGLMKAHDPDVICIQECGNLVPTANVGEETIVAGVGGTAYNMLFLPWTRDLDDGGNVRCSLAIFYKEGWNACATVWSDDGKKRPIIGVADGFGTWRVSNIHAGGVDYVNAAMSGASKTGKKWIVAGDFNQDPGTVAGLIPVKKNIDTGLNVAAAYVISPGEPTRGRRTLDFGVSNQDGKAMVVKTITASDHKAVLISI